MAGAGREISGAPPPRGQDQHRASQASPDKGMQKRVIFANREKQRRTKDLSKGSLNVKESSSLVTVEK